MLALLVLAWTCVIGGATSVSAQASGGSYGGSSSSSGGGGGGARSSRSSYDHGRVNDYDGPWWTYVAFFGAGLLIIAGVYYTSFIGPERKRRRTSEVRRLSLALDWHARESIQQTLDEFASGGRLRGAAFRRSLRSAAELLGEHRKSWLFAVDERHRLDAPDGRSFATVASDLRARFKHEVVRDGERRAGSGARPKREEGPGVVVVSLVLETDEHFLSPIGEEPTPEEIEAFLEGLREHDRSIRRFEVIWSPAEDGDRMSTAELEQVYPELGPLPAGASLGRHRCGHCRAAYAPELGECPACGAPRAAG